MLALHLLDAILKTWFLKLLFKVYFVFMDVIENLERIRAELSGFEQEIELVAVSKKQPQEKLQAALDAGQRVFGENRVQEALDHWGAVRESGLYPDLQLHLIGPLQSNKVAAAVALFDMIEVVDREKIARMLAKEMLAQGRQLPCYIQVNTGEEPQKSGVLPADLADFLAFCREACGLQIVGLMCIPPVDAPVAVHFAFLRQLAQQHGLSQLSMGMSGDYMKAAALGATSVRVGSAVFGARD